MPGRDFAEQPTGAGYLPYAEWAVDVGVVDTPGGAFDPEGAVTRGDAAKMLVAAFAHLAAVDQVGGVFADVADAYAAAAIEGLHASGVTKGCSAEPLRYCPRRLITRAQAASMLARSLAGAKPTVGLVVNEPQAARGYTLLSTVKTDEVNLIDHLGRVVHIWKVPGYKIWNAKLRENGNLLFLHQHAVGISSAEDSIVEVDRTGNIIWEYQSGYLHHDFIELPNNNILLILHERLREYQLNGVRPESRYNRWLLDYVQEVRQTGVFGGEVMWEWFVSDHLIQDYDHNQPNYGAIAANSGRIDINYTFDILEKDTKPIRVFSSHINSIDYNPILDQIMLSARNFSELWIIDRNTTIEEAAGPKDILYRWGNPQAYGAGSYHDQQLFWQHNAHWIPSGMPGEGNVLLFNNGNEFPGSERLYSSVDEITLPALQNGAYPQTRNFAFEPSQILWTYTAPDPTDFYADFVSGAQRLPNGNTQICSGPSGTIFQVTPDGTIVWKYINPILDDGTPAYQGEDTSNWIYRAPWYPPDYPGLNDMDLTPKGPLELYR